LKEKIEFINDLIRLTEDNDLSELSIDFKGVRVSIKKNWPTPPPQTMIVGHPGAVMMGPGPVSPGAAESPAKDMATDNLFPLKSPLAGVFYRAPKPGSPTFVNEGDIVEKEQVLCIIEAMKIMNEITAEIAGRISKICLKNAEVASEGEVLFYIEPVK